MGLVMTDYKKISEELHEKHSKTFEKLHMSEKNDEITALRAEVERLKAELHTSSDMNEVYEGRLQEEEAENERLREALEWIVGCALTEPQAMTDKAHAALKEDRT